ncbi:MAG TPA: hypothetical protein ENK18_21910 [Deltaproteobacteria bacterium]|nr:hypothetical protein [Deltaproteobacteria bacterium]
MHHLFGRLAILGALALVGCDGDNTTSKTGDTGTGTDTGMTDTGMTTDCATPLPILITAVSVTCDAKDVVTFDLTVDGDAADGLIFSQETGNTATASQYADEHSLVASGTDPCGTTGSLSQSLTTGAALGTDVPDESTVFTCATHHGSPQGAMSYAGRAYDSTGALADCYAWGQDPQGLIDNIYPRLADPVNPSELAGCAVAQGVY